MMMSLYLGLMWSILVLSRKDRSLVTTTPRVEKFSPSRKKMMKDEECDLRSKKMSGRIRKNRNRLRTREILDLIEIHLREDEYSIANRIRILIVL